MFNNVFLLQFLTVPSRTRNTLKRRKNREWYSRLSADAKHNKITRSIEMRAHRNSTMQSNALSINDTCCLLYLFSFLDNVCGHALNIENMLHPFDVYILSVEKIVYKKLAMT